MHYRSVVQLDGHQSTVQLNKLILYEQLPRQLSSILKPIKKYKQFEIESHLERWGKWISNYGQQIPENAPQVQRPRRKSRSPVVVLERNNSKPQRNRKSLSTRLRNLANSIKSSTIQWNSVEFISDLRVLPRASSQEKKPLQKIARVNSLQSIESSKLGSMKDTCSTRDYQTVLSSLRFESERNISIAPKSSHHLLEEYRDLKAQQLERMIFWKESEVDIARKKGQAERLRLMSQIKTLDRNNKDLTAEKNALIKNQSDLELTVKDLQGEIQSCKEQLKNKHVEDASLTMNSIGQHQCQCNKLKSDYQKNEHQLRKVVKLNEEYQGVICDLHLQNRFYRNHLEKCGQSKTKEFMEGEKKRSKAQELRKHM